MSHHGIAPSIGNRWYPQGWAPEEWSRGVCCAACRRGTKALGDLPCGNPDCHCHKEATETRVINRSAAVNHPVEGLGRNKITTPVAGTEREGKETK